MFFVLSVISLLYLAGIVLLLDAALNAPEGFEDDTGFRYGTEADPTPALAYAQSYRFHTETVNRPPIHNYNLHAT